MKFSAPQVLSRSGGFGQSPEDYIRSRLSQENQDASAFSKIIYLGHCLNSTANQQHLTPAVTSETHLADLREKILQERQDTTVRSPRSVGLIYDTVRALNDKFLGDIDPSVRTAFPDAYFTCQMRCACCESKCDEPAGHASEHATASNCVYVKAKNNMNYFCQK